MLSGCWVPVLLLLLLPAVTEAQSGDGETDMELRLSCTSHIMIDGSNLTCRLVGGRSDSEDDEDDEADGIERMTACYTDWSVMEENCVEGFGDTVSSKALNPVLLFNVTAHLKRGGGISTVIDLKKIVKPKSPQVWNVTFNQESDQTFIYIHTPYHKDYLKVDNQLFQLHIWNTSSSIYQNVSSSDHVILKIDMERLRSNATYQVKVRAIPQNFLQGSWSEWSETFSFSTAAGDNEHTETYTLIVCLVLLVVVTSSVVLFWKNKIFTFMWPSIPHPKHTLVQICKPNKGLLLNFKPEVFSALKVYPMEKTEEETEPSITAAAAEDTRSNPACSTHSSDSSRSTTSVSTEELELLSRSSSDGEDSLQSTSLSPVHVPQLEERLLSPQPECSGGGNEAEESGGSQQEEAYVTMSSFYQIK
ncbi:interleukin-7 receptor subunit alpha [Pagrus major]|uniref:interleukin-7 receptor subunit alpha n=1 Tax=Pagrus major TaxID=143350 RepID=UPI003CC88510